MKTSIIGRGGLALILCAGLFPQMVSCGTILYPERHHSRHSGQIDIAVALMDGIGLLIFIIPGVVAFAVDFHTGAIYLPKGHPNLRASDRTGVGDHGSKVIMVNPEKLDAEMISAAISRETGFSVRLDDPEMIVKKAGEGVDVESELKSILDSYGKDRPLLAEK